MSECVCVYIYTCAVMVCVLRGMWRLILLYECVYVCVYVHVCVGICVGVRVCLCIIFCINMDVYIYIYKCVRART